MSYRGLMSREVPRTNAGHGFISVFERRIDNKVSYGANEYKWGV